MFTGKYEIKQFNIFNYSLIFTRGLLSLRCLFYYDCNYEYSDHFNVRVPDNFCFISLPGI